MTKTTPKKKWIASWMLFLAVSFSVQSCTPEEIQEVINYAKMILQRTGWLEGNEDLDNIPSDILPPDGETYPSSVSLEKYFPPIGDQGQYGTCVVWSVGYNLKTSLNAIEKRWSSSDLSGTQNQTSPKDLWLIIPDSKKGTNCEGTNFEPALDALIASGAASMSTVPYTSLGNCTGTKTGNSNNRLSNYRKIAADNTPASLTVNNFKQYLSQGRPVAIGARLGDRFMNWSSSSTISSDTYNQPGMQHAYHALVLVGYDDNRDNGKGGKGAFRVRNSWGTSWGDNGSIWIEYDFFCKNFCFAAFVAENTKSSGNAGNSGSGYDLLVSQATDVAVSGSERKFSYDLYNAGDNTIDPSQKWSVVYMYYNATNGKDYGILFEDYYTDEFGYGDGRYDNATALNRNGWWNNYSLAPGKKAGETQYGEKGFSVRYTMPALTGKYYLIVIADAYDKIDEVNEENNFYFITADHGKPLEFVNGKIQNMPRNAPWSSKNSSRISSFRNFDPQNPVKQGNLNAYTPEEVKAMLLHDKKTGKLGSKMRTHSTGNSVATKKVWE